MYILHVSASIAHANDKFKRKYSQAIAGFDPATFKPMQTSLQFSTFKVISSYSAMPRLVSAW